MGHENKPSVLWHCWLGGRKGIRPVKTEWWGAGVVVCLERGADLHMAQLMPLPLTVSCFSEIQIAWYRPTWVVPEKGPLNGCVCVCVCIFVSLPVIQIGPGAICFHAVRPSVRACVGRMHSRPACSRLLVSSCRSPYDRCVFAKFSRTAPSCRPTYAVHT